MDPVEIHCMQGRLLPPENNRIQAFPRLSWARELALAGQAEVEGIEWIYESYGERENPLTTSEGRRKLRDELQGHGVLVRSLSADWFMEHLLGREPAAATRLPWLLDAAADAGIERIVVPCVDSSRLKGHADEEALVRAIEANIRALEATGLELHLETDLEPKRFGRLLERLDHPLIGVNYDTGNSASQGYDVTEEWEVYGFRVGSVHIKDRLRGGGTVRLGDGDADLETFFDMLHASGWQRPLVLQAARGHDGGEVRWVRSAARRVRELWTERRKAWN